jgi:aspartate-semialdehyde dehydrogenase
VTFHGEKIPVAERAQDPFRGIDIALFSAGTPSRENFAPIARDAGAIVIDNSSTFRMEPEVPLVIPEINAEDAKLHRGIIANPNCTTAVALMAIYPLHRVFRVQRVFAASYQAVSGSGARAIAELERQVRAFAENQPAAAEVYPPSDCL